MLNNAHNDDPNRTNLHINVTGSTSFPLFGIIDNELVEAEAEGLIGEGPINTDELFEDELFLFSFVV
jgi:hypothetical protein